MNITHVLIVIILSLIVTGIAFSVIAMVLQSRSISPSSSPQTTSAPEPKRNADEYREIKPVSQNAEDDVIQKQDADLNIYGILSLDDADDNEDSRYMPVDGNMDDGNNMKKPEAMVHEYDLLSLDVAINDSKNNNVEDNDYAAYNTK